MGAKAKRYVADVMAGRVVVGRLVRQTVERHVRDLERGHERGLYFDEAAGDRAIRYYAFLKHSKGEWGGQPIELEDWQAFILWCVFGWKKADGTRRFRIAYAEIARKNGKSTFAAGVGLQLFQADGEPGAEVYTAATKREQARIVHAEAVRMVKKSEPLKKRIKIQKDNLSIEATNSKFEPLGADGDTMDGLNISGAIVDELHAHKDRLVWDVLDTATGARRQPLIFAITTAGHDQQSICWEIRTQAIKATLPPDDPACYPDDTIFGYIATIDDGDDWTSEAVWSKANPNLGVSAKLDDLRRKCRKAQAFAGARNAFLRLHLNVWTQQETAWLDMAKWNACAGEPFTAESLKGRRCFGGIDLGSKIDLTSFALIFPPDEGDGYWRLLVWFFIPEETAEEREREDRVRYADWIERDLVIATPGNVADYDHVQEVIEQAARDYQLVDVGFDPWSAQQMANSLQKRGIACFEFRQGMASLGNPTKEFERLVVGGDLRHGGHEVLSWNAQCVSVKEDENQNIRPVKPKKKSGKRIDGIVASIMALGRAIESDDDGGASVYDTQDVRTL